MNDPGVPAHASDPRPTVSVLVFVREARSSVGETLESLAAQDGIDEAEVLVADASPDGIGEILPQAPWVRHLALGPCSMPEGKARAIEAARGEYVAILDACDQAEPDWLRQIQQGFAQAPDQVQAMGGEVHFDGPLNGANGPGYLFEYGAFAPELQAGPTDGDLPGNNVAYRRRVFDETCADLLPKGFYKPFFHDRIRTAGGQLHLHPGMQVRHRIRMGLAAFCVRRFHYGRCFGALRRQRATWPRKLWYVLGAPVVPLLLAVRHVRRAWQHPDQRALLTEAFPGLVLLCLAWGAGEWLGAWCGPGDAWKRVY